MSDITFKEWKDKHSEFMQKHIVESEGSRWGRVICIWTEKRKESGKITTIEHTYAAAINLKKGDIYLDCRKRKVWAKCCLYSLIQPLVLTVKTVYHLLLPVSIPYEIYKTVKAARKETQKVPGKELTKRIVKQIGKNLADTVRTPLYGMALTIIGIAGVVIGPLAPKILYDIRVTAGKVEKALNWGNENSPWILFKCFQPCDNLMKMYEWSRQNKDTEYLKENEKDDATLHGLTNFARAQIIFRRNNKALFNDCLKKYPEDKPYTSQSTPKKPKT